MEFHISHHSRKKYSFEEKLFSYDGNVIFADFRAVREFVQKINKVRAKEGDTRVMRPGEMNALGLIDEIMHAVIALYRKQQKPQLNAEAYLWLQTKLGEKALEETLTAFCTEFPPMAVVKGETTVKEYLSTLNPAGELNRYETVEEILLLWITNRNPAAMKLSGELFDEANLSTGSDYNKVIYQLNDFFKTQPTIDGMTLIDYLRAPALAHPDSLFDQLDYIRLHWASFLGDFLRRLLLSLDWMKEEARDHGFGGPGEVEIPIFGPGEGEYEAFSADSEWMPRLVLMAKNTYVWMDQLSKQYGYHITKLNEIPDQELQNLADEGFTGLWLIGLWERSKASQTIKQWCGNPEALASAYSLADYRIADDLGGEDAFAELKRKAWHFGIRLASDMVPNHMGIDSNWVLYHPDRFLSLNYCPFPTYSFNSGNLSPDPAIGIRIEDHYFSREDAAVVFQRVDYHTGDVRYIYHGNDGTTMPWNDTAQLNYLNAEVREAVIQTILQVAKRTPIIRFDAAMTLAKKHYQRLWFPEPGSGGDIATRAEHGMTKEEFDKAFPEEFWREVVDRVAKEAPDTLLLAEAFWLMENYFVRTLGMHRVYNSAFMNLLRDEDNNRYRILMKKTLEFDPEILKRYVNFMNNPDERTAVDQFGKGDKYFGICILMVTMPGLPMFGHGQVVGFSEKYGMEYKKAYKDEQVDLDLLRRHEREIFPLLHQRARFAEVKSFALYNFANGYGNVDENVYAYSNYGEGRHTLVIYNNRYGDTEGYVRQSVPYMVKVDGAKTLTDKTLSANLGLHDDADYFVVMHDAISGLNYVRHSWQICHEGLYFKLYAYQYYVFNEVYEVHDDSKGTWRKLCEWLNGGGTPDINESIQELMLSHVLVPYRNCFEGHKLRWLQSKFGQEITEKDWTEIRNGTWPDFEKLANGTNEHYGYQRAMEGLYALYTHGMAEMLKDPSSHAVPGMSKYNELIGQISTLAKEKPVLWNAILVAQQERLLTSFGFEDRKDFVRPNIYEDWHLQKSQMKLLHDAGWFEISPADQIEIIQWLYFELDDLKKWTAASLDADLNGMLDREDTRSILKANYYNGVCWFNQEMSMLFCDLLRLCGYYLNVFDKAESASRQMENMMFMQQVADALAERFDQAAYQYDKLFVALPETKVEVKKKAPAKKTATAKKKTVQETPAAAVKTGTAMKKKTAGKKEKKHS